MPRFAKALAAFLILPGTVAFAVPLIIRPAGARFHWSGAPLVAVGTVLLLWCVRDFYVSGKGTIAPWSPPKHLVIVGLYRYSRNPIYIAVMMILLGWTIAFDSGSLVNYMLGTAIVFQVRVVFFEEPYLARTHREEWIAYRNSVRRWLV